jgi:hypothetical protein
MKINVLKMNFNRSSFLTSDGSQRKKTDAYSRNSLSSSSSRFIFSSSLIRLFAARSWVCAAHLLLPWCQSSLRALLPAFVKLC